MMTTKLKVTSRWQAIDNYVFAYNEYDNAIIICQVRPTRTMQGEMTMEECMANAKLIANAPKMVEMLEEALDQLESFNPESEDTFTMKRIKEVLNKVN